MFIIISLISLNQCSPTKKPPQFWWRLHPATLETQLHSHEIIPATGRNNVTAPPFSAKFAGQLEEDLHYLLLNLLNPQLNSRSIDPEFNRRPTTSCTDSSNTVIVGQSDRMSVMPDQEFNISREARDYLEEGIRLAQHPATVNESAAAFEQAIRLHPEYAEAFFELGTMYYRWSHFHKAIEPLKKAIELRPEMAASYINLGMNYNLAGMYRDAESVLRKALEIVPNQTQAHYELGYALMQQHQSRAAIEHFRAAVQSNQGNLLAYHFLGYSLVVQEGDLRSAKELVEELKSLHPDEAKSLERLIKLNEP